MKQHSLSTPLTDPAVSSLNAGDAILLSGIIYTARDAAHKILMALIEKGENLPIDLQGQVIYYCGPTPAKPGRIIGSAGPTTSSRMDSYTPELLKTTGLKAMIGKGNRSPAVVESMVKNNSVYFAAVGGCGALFGKAVVASSVVCYEDLGPEAVYRLEVRNMPLIVAIDNRGNNLYEDGPEEYRKKH